MDCFDQKTPSSVVRIFVNTPHICGDSHDKKKANGLSTTMLVQIHPTKSILLRSDSISNSLE
eukprot:m.41533 g.41533  ORF g.41533 m.41533 type:complete len:62 (-) comp11834_c0_seq2:669-854(-)